MKSMSNYLLPIFLIIIFSTNADAQRKKRKIQADTSTTDLIQVNMKDGEVFIGTLIKLGSDSLILDHKKLGRLALPRVEIRKNTALNKNYTSIEESWKKEKYQSKYLVAPTALPVGEGNSYYSNYSLFINSFSFGLSENFSISTGFEIASIFASQFPILFVNPKVSFPMAENVYFGMGASVFFGNIDSQAGLGVLTYANTTIGSSTQNVTAGLGFAFSSDQNGEVPLVYQFGFTLPLSKRINLISEAVVDSSFDGAFNLGIRIITKGNNIFDIGLLRPLEADDIIIIGVPLLSLSVPL
jgi:hypothetical protein